MSLQAIPEGPLKNGYTTGACATACAKAALQALITQKPVDTIDITLPLGQQVTFQLTSCTVEAHLATCTTVKDAGDDPDVTHGATIGCSVSFNTTGVVQFIRGEGVGIVTLPGLAISVGEPAINPVPRKMIQDVVHFMTHHYRVTQGVDVKVFVVNGEEIAKRTLNSRIGILKGLSILGTTGIVKPFSASAYIASITQGIDVAIANHCEEIVINSGGRSETLLRQQFPNLPEFAFIQYGNWIGETLAKLKTTHLKRVTMGIMLGKAAKLAQGELDTHSGKSSWDKAFIYDLAIACGYSQETCQPILELNMARRLTELFDFREGEAFYQALARECHRVCYAQVPGLVVDIILISAEDKMIFYKHLNF